VKAKLTPSQLTLAVNGKEVINDKFVDSRWLDVEASYWELETKTSKAGERLKGIRYLLYLRADCPKNITGALFESEKLAREAEGHDDKGAAGDNEAQTASGESKKLISDFLAKERHAGQWKAWVDGELKKSNENYKRALGGSVGSRLSEEDDKDDNNYDVQMEKIMARFTNFNQILSSGGGQEEDDDDDDDENTQDSEEKDNQGFDEDDDDKRTEDSTISSFGQSDAGIKLQKVNLIVPEALDEEFIDNTYWKIGEPKPEDVDVDALLAELEA